MAYLRRHKNGRFYLRGRNHLNKLVEIHLPARTAREAQRLLIEWEDREEKIRLGFAVASESMTLNQLWGKYAPHAKALRSWYTLEKRFAKHILPALGERKIHTITPADIECLLLSKTELAPQTREHLRVHLAAIYTFATKKLRAFEGENPARAATKVHIPEREPKSITPDQLAEVLNHAGSSRNKLLILMAATTGLRRGELLGLRWSMVDLDNRIIRVNRSHQGETKTRKGRLVPIPKALAGLLAGAWATNELRAIPCELVFCTDNCEPYRFDFKATAILRGALERAGLSHLDVTFKDLRSTAISWLVDSTGDIRSGQLLAGHANDKTTREHYAKKNVALLRNQMDRAFASPSFPLSPSNESQSNDTNRESPNTKGESK